MRGTLLALALLGLPVDGAAAERNVLVEMFTNSHCGLCPPAHAALASYAATSPNAANIRYIYYHVPFPYPDDPLAQVASQDAAGRNQYYGPFSATPVTFFDGANQGNAYAQWGSALNARAATASPLTITLEAARPGGGLSVTATIEAVGALPGGALVFHAILVENVAYAGRNGVSPQNYVMRKMITGPTGEPVSLAPGGTLVLTRSTDLANVTNPQNAGIVVFVQESSSKAVLQSDYVSYASAVPIQLSSFSAVQAGSGIVRLRWRTETETNNFGFEIQRSQNPAGPYSAVGFVPGQGTTVQPQDYEYLDSTAAPGSWSYRLRQIDLDGTVFDLDPVLVDVGSVTSADNAAVPGRFALEQNYPNPFNPSTTIRFTVSAEADVRLGVYDLLGQQIRTLVATRLGAGSYSIVFDATGLAGGAYFYRLVAGDKVATKRLVVLK